MQNRVEKIWRLFLCQSQKFNSKQILLYILIDHVIVSNLSANIDILLDILEENSRT